MAIGSRANGSLALISATDSSPKRASAAQYYEKRDMPADAATLERIEAYSALATYPYHRKDPLPAGWRQLDETTLSSLAGELPQPLGGNVKVHGGALVDSKSGLTAMVFLHPDDRVYMLGFGGTTSGKAAMRKGWVRVMPGHNFGTTARQNVANVSAALGVTPTSYKQAAALATVLQRRLAQNPDYGEFTLHLTGHSKGGGEAMYAALSADTPIHATVFAPAHLTAGLIAELRPENLARATELIESYSAWGDPVPGLRGWVPGIWGVGAGHYFDGIKFRIPFKAALHAHVYTDKHLAHYISVHTPIA